MCFFCTAIVHNNDFAAWNRKCLPESDTEESAHTWLCIVCSAIHIFADIVRHVARLEAAGIFDTFSEEL